MLCEEADRILYIVSSYEHKCAIWACLDFLRENQALCSNPDPYVASLVRYPGEYPCEHRSQVSQH